MFNYFKKADLKKSHFDMSNYEPYTANFGELLPSYSDNVLAGDEWRMRIKEVIKTAPWVAPSMVKMSNSNYGFFTPYATIWEHWNDFITNMSSVQDTILSAQNKTDFSSICKWPSIPANLMQLPLKIANGYALPLFAFSYLKSNVSGPSSTKQSGSIQLASETLDGLIEEGFESFTLENDPDTILMPYTPYLYARLLEIEKDNVNNNLRFSPITAKNSLKWVFFADEVGSEINPLTKPVQVEWVDVLQYEKDVQGNSYNPYYVKHPIFSLNKEWLRKERRSISVPESAIGTSTLSPNIPSTLYVSVGSFGSNTPSDRKKKLSSSQKSAWFTTDADGKVHFNGQAFLSDSDFISWMLSVSRNNELLPPALNVYSQSSDGSIMVYCTINLTYKSSDYIIPTIPSFLVLNNIFENDADPRTASLQQCAIDLPLCIDSDTDIDTTNAVISGIEENARNITHNSMGGATFIVGSLSDDLREHNACGYSALGFLVYQCQKVSKLCDHFGFNVDAYSARGFKPFLTTEFNAFPFMAYSKIWNAYFRNSTLQSPELSYKHVNGLMYNSDWLNIMREKYCSDFSEDDNVPESSYYYTPPSQGWVLTLHNKPLEYTSGNYQTITIDSVAKAFSLITGYNMSGVLFNESPGAQVITTNDDDFFLPNYYNGLCVVKYKNIGRSLLTSGILEPTNGATIEEIPDTIVELRASEKLQKFWEDTAVARTVKKWYQSIFGTTPTHDNEDKPLLLGKASSEIQVGEILQQSGSGDTALGDRAGVALGGCHKGVASHYFNEHGFICVLSSVTMDIHFVDGEQNTQRSYHSYLDLPYAQFAHIGNEALNNFAVSAVPPPSCTFAKNPGLWHSVATDSPNAPSQAYGNRSSHLANATLLRNYGTHYSPNSCLDSFYNKSLPLDDKGDIKSCDYINAPFSYTSRYALDKVHFDKVHGEFRNSMSHWVPTLRILGGVAFTHFFVTWEFKERNSDLARFFVDREGDKFYVDRYNDCSVIRALPFASTPSSKA